MRTDEKLAIGKTDVTPSACKYFVQSTRTNTMSFMDAILLFTVLE
jgi:hypothetical protein